MLQIFYDKQVFLHELTVSNFTTRLTSSLTIKTTANKNHIVIQDCTRGKVIEIGSLEYIPRSYVVTPVYIQRIMSSAEACKSVWRIMARGREAQMKQLLVKVLDVQENILRTRPLHPHYVEIAVPPDWPRLCWTCFNGRFYMTIVSVPDPRKFFELFDNIDVNMFCVRLDPYFRCPTHVDMLTFLQVCAEYSRFSMNGIHKLVFTVDQIQCTPSFPWAKVCTFEGNYWWRPIRVYWNLQLTRTADVLFRCVVARGAIYSLPTDLIWQIFRFVGPMIYTPAECTELFLPRRGQAALQGALLPKQLSDVIWMLEVHPDLWYDEVRKVRQLSYTYLDSIQKCVPTQLFVPTQTHIVLKPKTTSIV